MDSTWAIYYPANAIDTAPKVLAFRTEHLNRHHADPTYTAPCTLVDNPQKQRIAAQKLKDEQADRHLKRALEQELWNMLPPEKKIKIQPRGITATTPSRTTAVAESAPNAVAVTGPAAASASASAPIPDPRLSFGCPFSMESVIATGSGQKPQPQSSSSPPPPAPQPSRARQASPKTKPLKPHVTLEPCTKHIPSSPATKLNESTPRILTPCPTQSFPSTTAIVNHSKAGLQEHFTASPSLNYESDRSLEYHRTPIPTMIDPRHIQNIASSSQTFPQTQSLHVLNNQRILQRAPVPCMARQSERSPTNKRMTDRSRNFELSMKEKQARIESLHQELATLRASLPPLAPSPQQQAKFTRGIAVAASGLQPSSHSSTRSHKSPLHHDPQLRHNSALPPHTIPAQQPLIPLGAQYRLPPNPYVSLSRQNVSGADARPVFQPYCPVAREGFPAGVSDLHRRPPVQQAVKSETSKKDFVFSPGPYTNKAPTQDMLDLSKAIKALPTKEAKKGVVLPDRSALKDFTHEGKRYFTTTSGRILKSGDLKDWIGNPALFDEMTWQYLKDWSSEARRHYLGSA